MTGPEHYRKAEEIAAALSEAMKSQNISAAQATALMAEAHVHATLAHAAATALGTLRDGAPWQDVDAWIGVASASN